VAQNRFGELVRHVAPELEPTTSDPLGRPSIDYKLSAGRTPLEFATASVFADAPAKVDRGFRTATVSSVTRSMLEVLAGARSEVIIASPYFPPGSTGMSHIKNAIDHHVRVVVFTNSLGATDEPLVHWRYARYRRAMLKLGVGIYELSADLTRDTESFGNFGKSLGRLHAKVAIVDRRYLFIGSMNFDKRCAWSNREWGLLIDSPPPPAFKRDLQPRRQ